MMPSSYFLVFAVQSVKYLHVLCKTDANDIVQIIGKNQTVPLRRRIDRGFSVR